MFRDLAPASLATMMRGRTIIDPFGVLDAAAFESAGFIYRTLGRPVAGDLPHLAESPSRS
jgi:UDPglucose 6-dehydrogenase